MGEMDVDDFARKLDASRPALVAMAIGGTFKGAIDDQKAIGEVLDSAKPLPFTGIWTQRYLEAICRSWRTAEPGE